MPPHRGLYPQVEGLDLALLVATEH
ncbi:hypothetical protein J2W32_003770 [Variovorax boronicumulans]|uniref:Uncharacterized protein n=1 Tax=Variovorax boronicumulans TaxID=436515 RepID=A0AAW8D2L5_9BURK|nr:hypothetical protein [Variovorax boronicumulans]MDQ0044625.1 hypothetical protein [Variovorax boronicumulans]MDQ0054712.1 hypothetical protein [Variovorax boronicumulans]